MLDFASNQMRCWSRIQMFVTLVNVTIKSRYSHAPWPASLDEKYIPRNVQNAVSRHIINQLAILMGDISWPYYDYRCGIVLSSVWMEEGRLLHWCAYLVDCSGTAPLETIVMWSYGTAAGRYLGSRWSCSLNAEPASLLTNRQFFKV